VDRDELESRLLLDEEFRAKLLELREADDKVHQAEAELRLVREHFHARIRELVTDLGVPTATVARYVSLGLQRVTEIVKGK
jgi:hypothetical protein